MSHACSVILCSRVTVHLTGAAALPWKMRSAVTTWGTNDVKLWARVHMSRNVDELQSLRSVPGSRLVASEGTEGDSPAVADARQAIKLVDGMCCTAVQDNIGRHRGRPIHEVTQ